MAIDGISAYQPAAGTTAVQGSGATLTMDDFFKLMVAQLSNQDMFNTVDDTQFMGQMAQFSMVQALSELSHASATAYGVSLIGKEVTVATAGDDGNLNIHTGIVDSVALYNGNPQIIVDDEKYALSSVMEVSEPNIIIPKDDLDPGEDQDGE